MRSEPDGFADQAAGLRKLLTRGGAQVITVLGARDGLGATSLVVNLAAVFIGGGKRVLVLDEGRSPGGVVQALGLRTRYDLLHVARGDKTWHEVLLRNETGVAVLPLTRVLAALPQLEAAARARLRESLLAAIAAHDTVLVDAGRGTDSLCAGLSGDTPLLLVLTPTASGITEGYTLLKRMVRDNGQGTFSVVVNRVGSEREALAVFDNMAQVARHYLQVRVEYLGYIPSDDKLNRATQLHRAVVEAFPASAAAMATREIAQGVLHVPDAYRQDGMMRRFADRAPAAVCCGGQH